MMQLAAAARALQAQATADPYFDSVGTDSRAIVVGQLFVALRGERFDGHDFVAQAGSAGAVAAMVDRAWFAGHGATVTLPLLVVDDTRQGLGALAAHWRSGFDIPLIGVTGSNGKTTVKELCASILRAQAAADGYPADSVLATRGNLNNDIGLPLMLLALRATHRAAVIEMGMSHPGEIAYLSGLARPTVALVNNAQRAHLAGLGGMDAIAREKGAIYSGLAEGGVAVINADDPSAALWRGLNAQRRTREFGLDHPAAVGADYQLQAFGSTLKLHTPEGEAEATLALPGVHNVRNALAAAAACLAAGVTLAAVVAGLAAYTGTRGRLQRCRGLNGALVLDDTYNANPDSVRAAIDVLTSLPGRSILVFGDMGEIGQTSAQLHDEIGGYAKSQGVDLLFCLGDMSAVAASNFGEGARHFAKIDDLLAALRKQLTADAVVLVKGSRFMRMERVVDALCAEREAGREGTH